MQDELREAIYRGEGFLVAGAHDQRNGRLDTPLGVTFHGTAADVERVVLSASAVHAAGEAVLALPEQAIRVALAGASAVGAFAPPAHKQPALPAVTLHDYGTGRAVFAAFDLLAEAALAGADSLFASLLGQALDYVHPPVLVLRSGAVVPVHLQLTNQGVTTPGHAVIEIPPATTVVDTTASTGVTALQTDGTWLWAFDLAASATEALTLWLQLPPAAGVLAVEAVLRTGQAPPLSDYATLLLPLEVVAPPTLATVRTTLAPLVPRHKAYRQADEALRRAEQQLARGHVDQALRELLQAATALDQLTTAEAVAVRLAVDLVLWSVAQQVVEP